ncbi:MAG: response regulator [Methanomassiliicoccales archaeon]|jgi:two-component system chemotaxis response regulator CheY|nr:response regulator [Methanomassiliicoccales archaeon]
MRILIADDDDDIREIIRSMLADHEIIEARNGHEAVELAVRSDPDIIIMDILMPEMDGIEASRQIQRENPRSAIICLTAFSAVKGPAMLEVGAKAVISKPFRKDDLLSVIRRCASGS